MSPQPRLDTLRQGVARRRRLLSCLCLLGTVLAPGCHALDRGGEGPPGILLVTVDTLRADRLGAYGSRVSPSPSPWIDSLAAGGVLFEQAVASAPETAPAVATLLTGLYQDRHGVPYNRATLPEDRQTLAESLRAAGYATAAFVGNRLVDEKRGFAQGFDHFEVVEGEPAQGATSTDGRLVARAGLWMAGAPRDKPWFVWVHLMDPHGPYNSAPPWWSRDLDYSLAVPERAEERPPVSDSNFGLGVLPYYQKLPGVEALGDYVRRYDGEVRYSDAQVGALLGFLSSAGRSQQTMVILTADHGESLVEHDELLQHGWFVYDPTVRVPLVVSWPGVTAAGRRATAQVCAVDIAPTVLEAAGLRDTPASDGLSFLAMLRGQEEGEPRGCFSVGSRANHPFALREGRMKAIVTPAGVPDDPRAPKGERTDNAEKLELYDLVADPAETRDLARVRGDTAAEMGRRLAEFRSRWRASGLRW